MTREELWTRALARGDYIAHGHIRRRKYVEVQEPHVLMRTRFWDNARVEMVPFRAETSSFDFLDFNWFT